MGRGWRCVGRECEVCEWRKWREWRCVRRVEESVGGKEKCEWSGEGVKGWRVEGSEGMCGPEG